MGTYNVSKIEGWLKDFTSAKDKFNNTYYSDYKNSYIRSCSDSTVVKMRNKLNVHYDRISKINSRIKVQWDHFLWDLKAIDNRLAGGKGSPHDSSVASKLSKLPTLKEYKADLKVRINSASAVVGTVDKLGWSEDKTFSENLENSLEILESSAAVIGTSIVSGIAGLNEDLVDGVLWLGTAAVTGIATLCGEKEWAESAQNKMMDVISYDVVGEANKIFYENTSMGRQINEKSLIKYDSEVAQTIQNVSTKVTEFAAATALTIATGGAAAPVAALIVGGTGFLVGAGDKAQENFSQEDRDFWGDSGEITIAGVIKAVEFYSEGKMGAGMIEAAGAIKSAGGVTNFFKNMKTVLSNGESSLFTKETLKNGFKATFKDMDTYMDSIGAAFNNITYDSENGIQIDWKGLATETACNFTLNTVFGFVGNAFETKMTSGMDKLGLSAKSPDVNTNSMRNTIDDVNPKRVEISAGTAKSETNLDSFRKEYDELLNQSKEPWFIKAKEAGDNGWAWDLNEVEKADNMVKRMQELESDLGIKNTGVPESKIYDYSQAKKEADAMVQKIRNEPIPGFEKIDTGSSEYQAALKEYYSKPSPSGKQDLSQIENPFGTIDDVTYDQSLIEKRKDLEIQLDNLARKKGKTINELAKAKQTSVASPKRQELADNFAKYVRSKAEIAEPKITIDMKALEDSNSKLVGLDFKLKGEDSLSRKIISDSIDDMVSYTKSATDIGDSVRYTLVINDIEYTNGIKKSLDSLTDKGYKINKFKNYWGGDIYQGVNVSLISPDGVKMELQFHTEDSFNTKEKLNHIYYEISRSKSTTKEEQGIANQIMSINQSLINVPDGIIDFKYK